LAFSAALACFRAGFALGLTAALALARGFLPAADFDLAFFDFVILPFPFEFQRQKSRGLYSA
jgi:hypothetical protein